MGKFSMADLLNSQSKQETEKSKFEIRHIPIEKLKPSEANGYGIRGIEELAANIEMLGLLHNLDVKEADTEGFYEIISGERRYRACKMLYENGNQDFAKLPCKVEVMTESSAISELKLLYANASARELTDYEKTYQAGRIKEILQELKKEGYKFPGRMREIMADMLDVSPAQVGRMEKINKNLSPEFKEEFKENKIGITKAYELSKLPDEEQEKAFENYKNSGNISVAKRESKEEICSEKEDIRSENQSTENNRPVKYENPYQAVVDLHDIAYKLERDFKVPSERIAAVCRGAAYMLSSMARGQNDDL